MDASTRGVPAGGYTEPVASRHPRIQVPRDPELDRAIERGRGIVAPNAPASQVVRALAIRGAAAFDEARDSSAEWTQLLLDASAGCLPVDLEVLRKVRDEGWR